MKQVLVFALACVVLPAKLTRGQDERAATPDRQTVVSIEGQAFHINGKPTYAGRTIRGMKVEGLLMNARLVQATFDDLNPETRGRWAYPDGPWDADRNTREFVAAMPEWRRHGLLCFTLNLQGGSPQGYSNEQPWVNSAIAPDGTLREDYMGRLAKVLDRADELGMVVILGYFYFGQEHRLEGEAAVLRATDAATDWLLAQGYRNVMVEIANEADHGSYRHDVVKAAHADELIRRVQERSRGKVTSPAGRLLVSTSLCGGVVPDDRLAAVADFLLLHGNGVDSPDAIRAMVDRTRSLAAYRGQPVLFNEDDHFDFDRPDNNLLAAVDRYAGWGYFDYRKKGEGFDDGFQSLPVNWAISSPRKRGFFKLLAELAGPNDEPLTGK